MKLCEDYKLAYNQALPTEAYLCQGLMGYLLTIPVGSFSPS